MVNLTQLILHIGDEMNVEQKRYYYGQANIQITQKSSSIPLLLLFILLLNMYV